MVTIVSNSPKWDTQHHYTQACCYMWNKPVQLEIHPLWPLCNLIFTFWDRKLLHLWNLPQVFSMPGVQCIHLPQKAPGHRRKALYNVPQKAVPSAGAHTSFWKWNFTTIKSTVLTITPSPLGFTYLLLRILFWLWWVGTSSLDIVRLLAKNVLQVCEELALKDFICSWAHGL